MSLSVVVLFGVGAFSQMENAFQKQPDDITLQLKDTRLAYGVDSIMDGAVSLAVDSQSLPHMMNDAPQRAKVALIQREKKTRSATQNAGVTGLDEAWKSTSTPAHPDAVAPNSMDGEGPPRDNDAWRGREGKDALLQRSKGFIFAPEHHSALSYSNGNLVYGNPHEGHMWYWFWVLLSVVVVLVIVLTIVLIIVAATRN